MRILHTSDWHLGRTLHGVSLHEHHERFHDFLIATVKERNVDVVVISGDVYDRAVPPVESVRLLDRTLAKLVDLTTVILTPGNHDSADRLGFGARTMRPGLHILASAGGIEHPVSVMDGHGEVLFFGLPFLDPDVARYALAGEDGAPLTRSHESVTREAMDRVRAKLAAHGGKPRSVVLAHTFIRGGEESDSERDITVGGVDSVSGGVFAGVDYLALGHLHGCQNVTGFIPGQRPVAWYSGSPLAYSFSERHHAKAVLLVEMDAEGACTVEKIPTPVPRRLVAISGTWEEVAAMAPQHSEDWVRVSVRGDVRPPHLVEKVRGMFPHVLLTEFVSTRDSAAVQAPQVTAAASPVQVVQEFFTYLTGAQPDESQMAIIEEVLALARESASEQGGAQRRVGAAAKR